MTLWEMESDEEPPAGEKVIKLERLVRRVPLALTFGWSDHPVLDTEHLCGMRPANSIDQQSHCSSFGA